MFKLSCFSIFTFSFIILFMVGCKKEKTNNISTSVTFTIVENTSTLDDVLKESSSLEIDKNGNFWSNNDRGNSPILYKFDSAGQLDIQVRLVGVDNNDWEDLALDSNDNLFVGDFGNNDNDRRNQAIYIIPNISTLSAGSVVPQILNFNLEDQSAFPPSESDFHFDIESLIVFEDSLYLFTKDRSQPFSGLTKLYVLPASPGTHEAKLISSFSTATVKKEGAITSADLSPDQTKLVLLSEQKIYLFSNFQIPNFFSGDLKILSNPLERQFEGVAFSTNCELYLTNEEKYGVGPRLLKINVCE